MYGKYHLYKKQLSYNSGTTWIDSDPLVTTTSGSPIALYPTLQECETGGTEFPYRWIINEGNYECYGTNKYSQEIEQVTYDNGETWVNFVPEQTRRGILVQTNSSDCGGTSPSVTDNFKIKQVYLWSQSTTTILPYDGNGTITRSEVLNVFYGKYTGTDLTIGDGVTWIGDEVFSGWATQSSFNPGARVDTITLHPKIPPYMSENSLFDKIYTSSYSTYPLIYVPAESVELYKNSPSWKKYADRIR